MTVILLEETSEDLIDLFFSKPLSSLLAVSLPVTPISSTLDPKALALTATLEAPPSLKSLCSGLSTGTGASGETLVTEPFKYSSRIMSPTMSIFAFLADKDS